MKLKLTLIITFIFFSITGLLLARLLPFHFYGLALEEGIDSDFFKLKVLPKKYLDVAEYKYERDDHSFKEDENMWKTLHFTNYLTPFPVHHPLILVIPLIELRGPRLEKVGLKYFNHSDKEITTIYTKINSSKFKLGLENSKLLSLPIFKNYIEKIPLKTVWIDLFSKEVKSLEH